MNHPLYILVNPHCHQGHGWKRWLSIRDQVIQRFPAATVLITQDKNELHQHLDAIMHSDQEVSIISAGGDGSLNALVNYLMTSAGKNLMHISIGAIGLGSSNDFLKPFGNFINDVPVRINMGSPARLFDVGQATFMDEENTHRHQYFIVNASMGVTAAANWAFNHPDLLLNGLKRYFTPGAILYAAVRTIHRYRNITCRMICHGKDEAISLSNINILKNPNVSGSFRYPQDIRPDDGLLGINICKDMNITELLQTLSGLSKGEFEAGDKRVTTLSPTFHLVTPAPVVLECDGETMMARDILFSVLPKAIKVYA